MAQDHTLEDVKNVQGSARNVLRQCIRARVKRAAAITAEPEVNVVDRLVSLDGLYDLQTNLIDTLGDVVLMIRLIHEGVE